MLAELLAWVLTPATLDARRTGHLTAAVSLWSRAFRCRAAWAPHEANCHALIGRAVEDLGRRRTCVVLGSGLLRDVPIDLLAARFDHVRLVDVVHLWPARLKVRRLANVELVDLDVTGTNDLLLGRATGIGAPLSRLAADPQVDLVISATCLSQLPLLPLERLVSGRGLAAHRWKDLGHTIVEGHLAALARFPCRVCLITDDVGLEIGADGREIERYDLLEGVALPEADATWDWLLAPLGETAADRAVHHRVRGFLDLHTALARTRGRSAAG